MKRYAPARGALEHPTRARAIRPGLIPRVGRLGFVRLPLRVAIAAAFLLAGQPAAAGKYDADLEAADKVVHDITWESGRLERTVQAAGRGYITPDQAVQRFQDHLYQYMVGEDAEAAEGFFALVTSATLADAGLHRDAEWYLADSLLRLGNMATAEARFLAIAEDEMHPFRDDAVRRLLEIYADTSQSDKFYKYFDREIARGRVATSDAITYSVGRSLFKRGEPDRAVDYLGDIPATSLWYAKAQYFLGAIAVGEARLDEAVPYFKRASEIDVQSVVDRELVDLSLLALGRVYYELGEYLQAAEFYDRVSGDSTHMPDKLYEIVWTFIKNDRYQDALRGAEIFLLAFPQHRYSPKLQLIAGQLHMLELEYDNALTAFETVIRDYTPIRERFAQLASSETEPKAYFQRVINADSEDESIAGLPGYAVAMMMADPDLSRAISVFRDLETQSSDIDQSERIIRELRAALDAKTGISSFDRVRYSALTSKDKAVRQGLALLELEEMLLLEGAARPDKLEAVLDLQPRRVALSSYVDDNAFQLAEAEEKLKAYELELRAARAEAQGARKALEDHEAEIRDVRLALETSGSADDAARRSVLDDLKSMEAEMVAARTDVDQLEVRLARLVVPAKPSVERPASERDIRTEIERLHAAYVPLRANGSDVDGQRLDGLHNALGQAHVRLDGVLDSLENVEESELVRIRARFEHEVGEVASQRASLQTTMEEAEEVSITLTRDGFGRLEDFFAESVLKADMGIVDVYWAEKLEISDEVQRVKGERSELLAEMERRFELIRQKVRQ
jgi:tetratricopeptide (TPR) repeat protein